MNFNDMWSVIPESNGQNCVHKIVKPDTDSTDLQSSPTRISSRGVRRNNFRAVSFTFVLPELISQIIFWITFRASVYVPLFVRIKRMAFVGILGNLFCNKMIDCFVYCELRQERFEGETSCVEEVSSVMDSDEL